MMPRKKTCNVRLKNELDFKESPKSIHHKPQSLVSASLCPILLNTIPAQELGKIWIRPQFNVSKCTEIKKIKKKRKKPCSTNLTTPNKKMDFANINSINVFNSSTNKHRKKYKPLTFIENANNHVNNGNAVICVEGNQILKYNESYHTNDLINNNRSYNPDGSCMVGRTQLKDCNKSNTRLEIPVPDSPEKSVIYSKSSFITNNIKQCLNLNQDFDLKNNVESHEKNYLDNKQNVDAHSPSNYLTWPNQSSNDNENRFIFSNIQIPSITREPLPIFFSPAHQSSSASSQSASVEWFKEKFFNPSQQHVSDYGLPVSLNNNDSDDTGEKRDYNDNGRKINSKITCEISINSKQPNDKYENKEKIYRKYFVSDTPESMYGLTHRQRQLMKLPNCLAYCKIAPTNILTTR